MPLRILLVDDHAQSRYALSKLLALAGHEVRSAATAAAALEAQAALAAQSDRPAFDLLIADIGLTGGAAVGLMRQARALYGIPGIAMTADDEEPVDPVWRAVGYRVRLRKPLRFREVEA